MSQQTDMSGSSIEKFQQWCFQETVEIERKKKELDEERKEFEEEQKSFKWEKKEFRVKQDMEEKRLAQKEKLLDMKWQILEAELRKLADEKEQVEQKRRLYEEEQKQHTGQNRPQEKPEVSISTEMFFKGVGNELALKKRYKDLIKIYHPDNLAGDTGTIQEINREYDRLKKKLG